MKSLLKKCLIYFTLTTILLQSTSISYAQDFNNLNFGSTPSATPSTRPTSRPTTAPSTSPSASPSSNPTTQPTSPIVSSQVAVNAYKKAYCKYLYAKELYDAKEKETTVAMTDASKIFVSSQKSQAESLAKLLTKEQIEEAQKECKSSDLDETEKNTMQTNFDKTLVSNNGKVLDSWTADGSKYVDKAKAAINTIPKIVEAINTDLNKILENPNPEIDLAADLSSKTWNTTLKADVDLKKQYTLRKDILNLNLMVNVAEGYLNIYQFQFNKCGQNASVNNDYKDVRDTLNDYKERLAELPWNTTNDIYEKLFNIPTQSGGEQLAKELSNMSPSTSVTMLVKDEIKGPPFIYSPVTADEIKDEEFAKETSTNKDVMASSLLSIAGMLDIISIELDTVSSGDISAQLQQLTKEEILKWVSDGDGLDTYVEDSKALIKELSEFYTSIHYEHMVNALNKVANMWDDVLKQIDDYAGTHLTKSDNKSTNPMQANTSPKSKLLFNDDYTLNDVGLYLYAWTSAFTPFETNLNDYYDYVRILPQNVQDTYEQIRNYHVPVYIVDDYKSAYLDMVKGNTQPLVRATLGNFRNNVESGDAVLLADFSTQEASNQVDNLKESVNLNTGNSASPAPSATPSATPSQTPATTVDKVAKSISYYGPIYASSTLTNYPEGEKSIFSFTQPKNAYENQSIDTSVLASKYSNTAGANQKTTSMSILSDRAKSISVDMLHMNYMMMHNTLEDKSTVIDDTELLFMDALGNIITQSGYVVVPAFANAVYYESLESYPTFNAMFINSYPYVTFSDTDVIGLRECDKNKIVMGQYMTSYNYNLYEASTMDNVELGFYQFDKDKLKCKAIANNLGTGKMPLKFINGEDVDFDLQDKAMCYMFANQGKVSDEFSIYGGYSIYTTAFTDFSLTTKYTETSKLNISINTIPNVPKSPQWITLIQGARRYLDKHNGQSAGLLEEVLEVLDVYCLSVGKNISQLINEYTGSADYRSADILRKAADDYKLGSTLEDFISSQLLSKARNILLSPPTIMQVSETNSLANTLPVILIYIALVAMTVYIIYNVIMALRNDIRNIFTTTLGVAMLSALAVFTLFYYIPFVDNFYSSVISNVSQNSAFYSIISSYENRSKTVDYNRYNLDTVVSEESLDINLQLEALDKDNVKTLRKNSNSETSGFSLYNSNLDNTRYYLVNDIIYLQRSGLYTNVNKLFDACIVEDVLKNSGKAELNVLLKEDSIPLQQYTPFYHILESLTHKVNVYNNEGTSSYKLLPYDKQVKTTGRANAYFHSIFFLKPDAMSDYLDDVELMRRLAVKYDLEYNDPTKLDGLTKAYNAVELNNTVLRENATYLMGELGDSVDWIGLNSVFLRNADNAPFNDTTKESLQNTYWGSKLNGFIGEDFDRAVAEVNIRTKDFIIEYLNPIESYISDDTMLKTIALYATVQFNKVFSQSTGMKFYPQSIDTSGVSNHYLSIATILPRKDIFTNQSQSLAYTVIKNTGKFEGSLVYFDKVFEVIKCYVYLALGILETFWPVLITITILFRSRNSSKRLVYVSIFFVCFNVLYFIDIILTNILATNLNTMDISTKVYVNIAKDFFALVFALLFVLLIIRNAYIYLNSSITDRFESASNFGQYDDYVYSYMQDVYNSSTSNDSTRFISQDLGSGIASSHLNTAAYANYDKPNDTQWENEQLQDNTNKGQQTLVTLNGNSTSERVYIPLEDVPKEDKSYGIVDMNDLK